MTWLAPSEELEYISMEINYLYVQSEGCVQFQQIIV